MNKFRTPSGQFTDEGIVEFLFRSGYLQFWARVCKEELGYVEHTDDDPLLPFYKSRQDLRTNHLARLVRALNIREEEQLHAVWADSKASRAFLEEVWECLGEEVVLPVAVPEWILIYLVVKERKQEAHSILSRRKGVSPGVLRALASALS